MDSQVYPHSSWLDSPLSVAYGFASAWLTLATFMMLSASPVRAQSWETSIKMLPQLALQPLIAADITGDGADELLILTENRQLALLEGLESGSPTVRPLAVAPPALPESRPYRFPSSKPMKDRIAWLSGNSMVEWTMQPGSEPLARTYTIPAEGRFFPPALGWRCMNPDKPWVGAVIATDNGCLGLFCMEPLPNGEIPARTSSVLCDHRGGPVLADLDGSGLNGILQSDPTLRNWLFFRENTSRLWASFPSRIKWRAAFVGDFDGNQRDDILVYGEPFHTASIAYSRSSYALEQAVSWPFPAEVTLETIAVGDFNGDGRSDLVGVANSRVYLAYARSNVSTRSLGKGAVADFSAPQEEPAVCLGYNPFALLGTTSKWGVQSTFCPAGNAYFGAAEGLIPDPARASVLASCCRLPRSDILLDEHLLTDVQCPEGYVITGSYGMVESRPTQIRCTRINYSRYTLGPLREGRYWGNGLSSRGQSEQLQITDLPAAIRSGIGRADDASWTIDGCVGNPVGALLVKKGGKHCQESGYRELLEGGKPVKMFPDCLEIENVFDPTSGCR